MHRVENPPTRISIFLSSNASLSLLLVMFMVSSNCFAANPKQDVVIYQSEGLWLLRQPWSEVKAWCQWGGGSRAHKVYDVYAYYDVPHEQRLQRLGSSYQSFVQDKVIPAIKQICGPDIVVHDLTIVMYRKNEALEPNALVDDLSKSKTPPLDVISFKIDDTSITPVSHEPKEASWHMTPAQIRALDPRSNLDRQQAAVPTRFADYVLYQGTGFTVTSSFDRPGRAWCEHVYVTGLVEYEGSDDAIDLLFKPDYESFLQAEIVPKIQKICPNFPDAAEYFTQSIRLEFKRAGDSHVVRSMGMGFGIGPDGSLAWREGREVKGQFEKNPAPAAQTELPQIHLGQSQQIDEFIVMAKQGVSGAQDMIKLAEESQQQSSGAFVQTQLVHFLRALDLNTTAINKFDDAANHYQRAHDQYELARKLNRDPNIANLETAFQHIREGSRLSDVYFGETGPATIG